MFKGDSIKINYNFIDASSFCAKFYATPGHSLQARQDDDLWMEVLEDICYMASLKQNKIYSYGFFEQ